MASLSRNGSSGGIHILQVEDNPGDARLISEYIREASTEAVYFKQAQRLSEAEALVGQETFDVILLDLTLPDSSGLDTLHRMQTSAPSHPIVVLSGIDNEQNAIKAVQSGAQDYLVKGKGDGDLILRSIRYAIERKQSAEDLAFLARTDPLTKLPNRAYFLEYLNRELSRSQRNDDLLACLFLDVDRFKQVNDSLGHDIGDKLLIKVAERLKQGVRKSDFVARLGGDEFTIVMTQCDGTQAIKHVVDTIIDLFQSPFDLGCSDAYITTSIGISTCQAGTLDATTLIKQADIAMYQAKDAGRNTYRFFTEACDQQAKLKIILQKSLTTALEQEQFRLVYQPQLDINTGKLRGMEALLRWHHPQQGLIYPDYFIGMLEETGLVNAVGEWVLRTACLQQFEWIKQGLVPKKSWIAVNISVRQLVGNTLCHQVENALLHSGLAAECLDIEITESMLMGDVEHAIEQLQTLHDMGASITIDDFGTGYSSLRYLTKLPLDRLKVDRSFVQDLLVDKKDADVTRSIISLAHTLKLDVIAEGVDNKDKLDYLRQLKCDFYQGYFYSKPLPADEVIGFIASK